MSSAWCIILYEREIKKIYQIKAHNIFGIGLDGVVK